MGGRRRRRRFGRPPKHRVLSEEPGKRGFSPNFKSGKESSPGDKIEMTADEYEAYRLTEYMGLSQNEAAEQMKISRGTLWRILESAKKKLAKMMVEGQQLYIAGGHYVIGSEDDSSCPECERDIEDEEG
jgi:predicted DNA-binding protein (UPF0251 family)